MTLIHGNTSRLRVPRQGSAVLELALLLPLVLTFLLGVWEVGRMVETQQLLSNAAREGGRQASTGQQTNAQVQQVVLNYLKNAGVPTQNVVVTVSDLTTPGTDASSASPMDQLQVSVSIPFKDVRWSTLSLITTNSTQLSGKATWYSLKDQQYPTTVTAPLGY